MPSALLQNAPAASPTMLKDKPRETREMGGIPNYETKKPTLGHSDNEMAVTAGKKPHKQSLDYIWRTGLAGGLAGSAV